MPHPPFQNPIGTPFIELQSVDSTNNYALDKVYAGLAQHGTVFFAHEQVAGKGQRGKTWSSDQDAGIIISTVIKSPPPSLAQQFQLSACAGLSIYEFFSGYAGMDCTIKWPNDLYWQDRKAGGILIENIVGSNKTGQTPMGAPDTSSSQWLWAIVGIGININQSVFPADLKNPVSLKQITGKEYDPVILAKELCQVIDHNFKKLCEAGFAGIYKSYEEHLYKKGQPVRFRKGSRSFEATVKTISPSGNLIVQHAIEEEFTLGEVEWILPAGQ